MKHFIRKDCCENNKDALKAREKESDKAENRMCRVWYQNLMSQIMMT